MNFLKKNNRGDHPEAFVSASGDKVIPKYQGRVDKITGQIELVEVGLDPWYERIQSYKDMCDVNRIVMRYMSGEVDILNQVQGVFADFSVAPRDLASAYRELKDAEIAFDMLPADVKQRFGNSFYSWLSSSGSAEWYSAMSSESTSGVEKDGVVDES